MPTDKLPWQRGVKRACQLSQGIYDTDNNLVCKVATKNPDYNYDVARLIVESVNTSAQKDKKIEALKLEVDFLRLKLNLPPAYGNESDIESSIYEKERVNYNRVEHYLKAQKDKEITELESRPDKYREALEVIISKVDNLNDIYDIRNIAEQALKGE